MPFIIRRPKQLDPDADHVLLGLCCEDQRLRKLGVRQLHFQSRTRSAAIT